LLFEFYH